MAQGRQTNRATPWGKPACFMAAALAVAACGPGSPAGETREPLDTSPRPDLRAAYLAQVEADASVEFLVRRLTTGLLRAGNPVQGFDADLSDKAVSIMPSAGEISWRLSLTLAGRGCDGALDTLPASSPIMRGNRVEYGRGDVVEWYVNGPLGLEQGFDIIAPPPCKVGSGAASALAFDVDGDLRPVLARGGNAVDFVDDAGARRLTYTGLTVHDALGQALPARLGVTGGRVWIHFEDRGAVYPVVVDPIFATQQAKLVAANGLELDLAGEAVAIDGDTAVIGAPNAPEIDWRPGAAYVFVRSGGQWTQQAKLVASDGVSGNRFGAAVAIVGDTAIIGAHVQGSPSPFFYPGAAYIFERNGTSWSEIGKLVASDAVHLQHFGYAVAMDGNTAIIGAAGNGIEGGPATKAGDAYVFVKSQGTWTEQKRLAPAGTSIQEGFGMRVSVRGDLAVIGAPGKETLPGVRAGGAYVFVQAGGTWTEQATLLPSDGLTGDTFGGFADVDGDTALIGALRHDVAAGVDVGAAYVFRQSQGIWQEEAKLTPSDGLPYDYFGSAGAIRGDTAVIGAYEHDNLGALDTGAAYVFTRNGNLWAQDAALGSGDPHGYFGTSVAMDGSTVLVGAMGTDTPTTSFIGAAYVFSIQQDPSALGAPCVVGGECASGFCVDGVCCDNACGAGDPSDCQACGQAAGAAQDGVCGVVAAGVVCRDAASECDIAEVCDGTATTCTADVFSSDGTSCMGGMCLAGQCSGAETGGAGGAGQGGAGGAGLLPDVEAEGGCACTLSGQRSSASGFFWGVIGALLLGLRAASVVQQQPPRRRSAPGRR